MRVKRTAALLAVIASNEEMFRAYRQKVKNEQGEDKELELYSETIEEQSEQKLPVDDIREEITKAESMSLIKKIIF